MPTVLPTPETTQAAYYVISSLSRASRNRLHGVLFNKGMCLLNYRLRARGIDIKLPHCWYKHGDIVVEHWMPRNVQWPRPNEEQTYVYWQGPPPNPLTSQETEKEIVAMADALRSEFTEDERGIERIVEEVYRYAPFSFQDRFRRLFILLRSWRTPDVPVEDFVSKTVVPHFRELIRSFQGADFPDLVLDLHKYAFVSERLLEKREGVRYILEGLSEDFWLHFCKGLRLHPKAHENVPEPTLEIWEEEKRASYDLFRAKLKYWATLAERETGIGDFAKPSVQAWLFPSSWGPESRDSGVAIDQTLYG